MTASHEQRPPARHTIAIVGGTGPEGRGLATRFALAGHRVIIGSRAADRGAAAAEEVRATLGRGDLGGDENAKAVLEADIVVVTVPYEGQVDTLEPLKDLVAGKLVIDTVVPVQFDRGPRPIDVAAGSATEEAAALLPESRVVGAFHNLAAGELLNPELPIEADVLITGGNTEDKAIVSALAETITGVRAIDAGPLRFSRFVEGLTILLIGVNGRYKAHTGVRLTGLPE